MNELIEFLIKDLGYTLEDANETIENGEAYLMTERDLYEYIDEVLQLDSMPKQIQLYFDYEKFIRDMQYNGELYDLKLWPNNKFIILHR